MATAVEPADLRRDDQNSVPTSRWIRLAFAIAEQLQVGALTIEGCGVRRRFDSGVPGPEGHLRLHRPRAVRRFATGGGLGFSEAYLDGDWDSEDVAALLETFLRNEAAFADRYYGRWWSRWLPRLQHLLRSNTRRGSRRNILAHYDLGNAFYGAWLDPSMTYSAARFAEPDQSLELAQRQKYVELARRLEIAPDQRVLEIGCGWGGFAALVASEIGARVTALTISKEQHSYASRRIQEAGLSERVDVLLKDYRDITGSFDRIASIEMFEAVGERYWPVFFAKLRDRMARSGRAGLQVITIADPYFSDYRRSPDFIQRHVFPGGMLPSPMVLREQITKAGLQVMQTVTFGLDYARTLGAWNQRFQEAWPALCEQGFDARFKRLWEYYLAYCEAGFRSACTDVCQVTIGRT